MTDTTYVFTTSRDQMQVWLVNSQGADVENVDEAETFLEDQILTDGEKPSDFSIYYEGLLEEFIRDATRDGVAVFNQ